MSMSDPFYNHLGSIWYHSEPLESPIPQTSILTGIFFATSYSKSALTTHSILLNFNMFSSCFFIALSQKYSLIRIQILV